MIKKAALFIILVILINEVFSSSDFEWWVCSLLSALASFGETSYFKKKPKTTSHIDF